MKPAVGYIRVSTAVQRDHGISPEAQESRIKQWAQDKGFDLLAIKNDNGISGKTLRKRPGAQEAIAMACEHKAALVVYSLSRLARSTRQLYDVSDQLKAAGAGLVSLTEPFDTTTPEGNMLFGILAVMAQFERELTSKRTKEVAAYLRANHRKAGRLIPYGMMPSPDGTKGYVPNPEEQAILQRIRALAHKGTTKIAALLEKEGITNRKGKPFCPQAIGQMLRGANNHR